MPTSHYDLPVCSYVFLGLLAIAHEALGLRTALMLGLCIIGIWVGLSLLVALVAQLRPTRNGQLAPPK